MNRAGVNVVRDGYPMRGIEYSFLRGWCLQIRLEMRVEIQDYHHTRTALRLLVENIVQKGVLEAEKYSARNNHDRLLQKLLLLQTYGIRSIIFDLIIDDKSDLIIRRYIFLIMKVFVFSKRLVSYNETYALAATTAGNSRMSHGVFLVRGFIDVVQNDVDRHRRKYYDRDIKVYEMGSSV